MGNISNVIPAEAGNAYTYDYVGNRQDMAVTNNLNQYTAAGTTSFYYDASGNLVQDANYFYEYDPENRLTDVWKLDPPTQNLDSFAAYTKGGDAPWVADPWGFAQSGALGNNQESWMYIDVPGPGTVGFQWTVSSEEDSDYLEFLVDGGIRDGISGEVAWQPKSFTITGGGSHRLKWRYVRDSNDWEGLDCGRVKDVNFTPPAVPEPDHLAEATDSGLVYTTGGDVPWCERWEDPYHGSSMAASDPLDDSQQSWMQTTVQGAGTIQFWWKVSSEPDSDYLEFYIDGVPQSNPISGEVAWEQRSYPVTGTGTHTLKWRYVKNSDTTYGDDRGEVDWVQWTGSVAEPDPTAWTTRVHYVYDACGRRSAKSCDGRLVLTYIYDGDHCIAEYGAGNDLHRKYIYGPCMDEPISMIESAGTYAGTYYYHCDALGSVAALTNSSGTTVEVYEYDVYGRVGASVPAHPNRIMFTGREYDKETGLYYYRARYYNPQIGRFLQTDPVGYGAGMNFYTYCMNNPLNGVDPSGLKTLYLYYEYAPGISQFFELSTGSNGEEWNLAGIATRMGVDPNRLVPATFGGYGDGYVLKGGSTGYSDPSATMGNFKEITIYDDASTYTPTETGPLDGGAGPTGAAGAATPVQLASIAGDLTRQGLAFTSATASATLSARYISILLYEGGNPSGWLLVGAGAFWVVAAGLELWGFIEFPDLAREVSRPIRRHARDLEKDYGEPDPWPVCRTCGTRHPPYGKCPNLIKY